MYSLRILLDGGGIKRDFHGKDLLMMVIRYGQVVRNIAVDQVFVGGLRCLSLSSINWRHNMRFFIKPCATIHLVCA